MPIVHGLEQQYSGRIDFLQVNIHNPSSRALMDQYGFTSTPELYLVELQPGGSSKVIGAWDGEVTRDALRQAFDQALQ